MYGKATYRKEIVHRSIHVREKAIFRVAAGFSVFVVVVVRISLQCECFAAYSDVFQSRSTDEERKKKRVFRRGKKRNNNNDDAENASFSIASGFSSQSTKRGKEEEEDRPREGKALSTLFLPFGCVTKKSERIRKSLYLSLSQWR